MTINKSDDLVNLDGFIPCPCCNDSSLTLEIFAEHITYNLGVSSVKTMIDCKCGNNLIYSTDYPVPSYLDRDELLLEVKVTLEKLKGLWNDQGRI